MTLLFRKTFFAFAFLLILFVNAQTPADIPDKAPNRLVNDYGHFFDAMQINQLENKLVAYNDSTSTQIVIVTFKSLDGYPLETTASEIGEKWGVGQKGEDNGIVILLSKDDRKITIRTGYGAQIHLTPTLNQMIINNEIVPSFKQGNYYDGIQNGLDAIFKVMAGNYKAKPKSSSDDDILANLILLIGIVIFVIIIILISKGGGGNSGGGRKRNILQDLILMNAGGGFGGRNSGGFGGGSWGGGSSGGFGGFGGGSFGGGGSSGSW